MSLFAPDLYRNFSLGFVAGALMVAAATVGDWGPQLESPAYAAEQIEAPHAGGEFAIQPIEANE